MPARTLIVTYCFVCDTSCKYFFPHFIIFFFDFAMVIFHQKKKFFQLCGQIYLFYYYYFWIWCHRKVFPTYKGINSYFLPEFIWVSFLTFRSLILLGFTLYTNSWATTCAKTLLVWYMLLSGESRNNGENYYTILRSSSVHYSLRQILI